MVHENTTHQQIQYYADHNYIPSEFFSKQFNTSNWDWIHMHTEPSSASSLDLVQYPGNWTGTLLGNPSDLVWPPGNLEIGFGPLLDTLWKTLIIWFGLLETGLESLLDHSMGNPLWFDVVLVNRLVPCAWPSSGPSEIWRLRLLCRSDNGNWADRLLIGLMGLILGKWLNLSHWSKVLLKMMCGYDMSEGFWCVVENMNCIVTIKVQF